jgi:hypothetical protein
VGEELEEFIWGTRLDGGLVEENGSCWERELEEERFFILLDLKKEDVGEEEER